MQLSGGTAFPRPDMPLAAAEMPENAIAWIARAVAGILRSDQLALAKERGS